MQALQAELEQLKVLEQILGRMRMMLYQEGNQTYSFRPVKVWLAQVSTSYDCRHTLLPVVPGQSFRPEAERALEHKKESSQASEAWCHWGRSMGCPAQCSKKCGARDLQQPLLWCKELSALALKKTHPNRRKKSCFMGKLKGDIRDTQALFFFTHAHE